MFFKFIRKNSKMTISHTEKLSPHLWSVLLRHDTITKILVMNTNNIVSCTSTRGSRAPLGHLDCSGAATDDCQAATNLGRELDY